MLSMLEGVDVVCFAACYFLAFIIEIVRFVLFKDRYQSAYLFSVLFASFGVIAHLFFYFTTIYFKTIIFLQAPAAGFQYWHSL